MEEEQEDKFFDVKNETTEEEVLGYMTARDGELTKGAMEEEQEDEQEVKEEVDIIEAREGDNMEKSGTNLQCSTLGFQSSNNSDNEENGPSNEAEDTIHLHPSSTCRKKAPSRRKSVIKVGGGNHTRKSLGRASSTRRGTSR